MKKVLLGAFAFALSANLSAQNPEPVMMLIDRTSDDGLEYEKYFYNSDLLMNEKQVLYSDGIEAKEIFNFNTGHQVTKLEGFQLMDGEWKNTYYIDYAYDADGNKISRTNYNSFGGPDFTLGGIYDYQYDNNRRVSWQLTMMDELVEQGQLIYDGEGRLTEEIGQDTWATGQMEDSWKIIYTYNTNGALQKANHYYWTGSSWDAFSTDQFFYDADGNCTKWEHSSNGAVTNKFEYEYETQYQREELVLPTSPEDDADPFRWVEYKNQMVLSHWYTLNDDDELIYICDFIYNYTPVGGMGVSDMNGAEAGFMIYPNPAKDQITVLSEGAELKNITVTDMTGRVVMKNSAVNKSSVRLDISQLAPGVYVVQGNTSKGNVSKRIVVK